MRNDALIVVDASWRAAQRVARSDVQIALENVVHVNTMTLLHSDRQQEMRNADRQAH
jgi:DTW domain-containing protein YfiP